MVPAAPQIYSNKFWDNHYQSMNISGAARVTGKTVETLFGWKNRVVAGSLTLSTEIRKENLVFLIEMSLTNGYLR